MIRRLLALIPCIATVSCSDEVCGPADAPADGVTAAVTNATFGYGSFTSSANNDCSVEGHPTSLTLDGVQTAPATEMPLHITFCLPRPDEIGDEPIALDDAEHIEVIDLFGETAEGCLLALDRDGPVTGTITFSGYCGNGTDPAGYAIAFDGAVAGTLSCPVDGGPGDEPVTIELSGRAAVEERTP